MKSVRVAAAVIVDGSGRILATERSSGEFRHRWEFPGGKIEDGESGEDAVVREIEEELGCHVAVEKRLATVEYDYPSFHLSMECFVCRIVSGIPSLLEHEASVWLFPDALDTLDWLPADTLVVSSLKEFLGA